MRFCPYKFESIPTDKLATSKAAAFKYLMGEFILQRFNCRRYRPHTAAWAGVMECRSRAMVWRSCR